jgi:hypothetical protein
MVKFLVPVIFSRNLNVSFLFLGKSHVETYTITQELCREILSV